MKDPWDAFSSRTLKDAMYWHRITYKDLAERLAPLGVDEHADRLRNKINRGKFSLTFFLQCLRAMEMDKVELDWSDLEKELARTKQPISSAKSCGSCPSSAKAATTFIWRVTTRPAASASGRNSPISTTTNIRGSQGAPNSPACNHSLIPSRGQAGLHGLPHFRPKRPM
ncbi:MAG: DUF6471 domain-containing protein [Betaproteobacteria bacterium]|nr:DUF6471 domain-containing protein [Betaproteobacteria bacterium]